MCWEDSRKRLPSAAQQERHEAILAVVKDERSSFLAELGRTAAGAGKIAPVVAGLEGLPTI